MDKGIFPSKLPFCLIILWSTWVLDDQVFSLFLKKECMPSPSGPLLSTYSTPLHLPLPVSTAYRWQSSRSWIRPVGTNKSMLVVVRTWHVAALELHLPPSLCAASTSMTMAWHPPPRQLPRAQQRWRPTRHGAGGQPAQHKWHERRHPEGKLMSSD
jgi:hypothetical protein